MFRTEIVTEKSEVMQQIDPLYLRAFPENERRPLGPLLRDHSGNSSFLAFYDDDTFCGFACIMRWKDISHIIYITTEEDLRGHHYGSLALQAMHKHWPEDRFIVDIESDRPDAPNAEQRRLRRHFYMQNGYRSTPVHYPWRGEDYDILAYNGTISSQEFQDFWHFFDVHVPALANY